MSIDEQLEDRFWLFWGIAPKRTRKYNKGINMLAFIKSEINEKEKEIIILHSDINRAIGCMQGCGYPDKYLEKKYPLPESK